MASEILTKRGEVKAIRHLMGVSEPTVIHALQGKTSTALAEKIRKMAIKRGGVEISNK